MSDYHPVLHLGEPKHVPHPVTGLHVFQPDHNLYCDACGQGELGGDHGIIGIVDGARLYESDEVEQMYADADEAAGLE